MPEHITDTEGENPMSVGTSTVAPNIERKCCNPKGKCPIPGNLLFDINRFSTHRALPSLLCCTPGKKRESARRHISPNEMDP